MTLDELKFYTMVAFQVINMSASAALWIYLRYGDRNKQVDDRFEAIELDFDARMDSQDKAIARLAGLIERAPTHADLGDLYDRVNATAQDVSRMAGELRGINDNLRLILSQIAAKGMK
ncbi:MAG: hypothetical protein ACOZB0_04650 [Pseudomonadota bacterium]